MVAGRDGANAPMLTKATMVDGRLETGILPTGQGVGVIDELPTVEELVDPHRRRGRADARPPREGGLNGMAGEGPGARDRGVVHDRRRAPPARRPAARSAGATSSRQTRRVPRTPACDGTELAEVPLSQPRDACGRTRPTTTRRRRRTWRPSRSCRTPSPRSSSPTRSWSCSARSTPAPTLPTLRVGVEVELVVGTLYEDDDHEYVVWTWAPVGASTSGRTSNG